MGGGGGGWGAIFTNRPLFSTINFPLPILLYINEMMSKCSKQK